MYTMEIDGRVAARGDSIVNYSLEQILDFLADYKKIKNINPMI